MRKLGYTAECVEHRRGSFIRIDLFGFADVMAFKPEKFEDGGDILLIQAYHKKEELGHSILHPLVNDTIKKWIESGGRFEHHLWSFKTRKGRKYWSVERREIK